MLSILVNLNAHRRKNPEDLNHKQQGLDAHELAEVLKFAQAHRALVADPDFSNMTEVRLFLFICLLNSKTFPLYISISI
jgi:hypothetical protein